MWQIHRETASIVMIEVLRGENTFIRRKETQKERILEESDDF
jgi:hypothetical protein